MSQKENIKTLICPQSCIIYAQMVLPLAIEGDCGLAKQLKLAIFWTKYANNYTPGRKPRFQAILENLWGKMSWLETSFHIALEMCVNETLGQKMLILDCRNK